MCSASRNCCALLCGLVWSSIHLGQAGTTPLPRFIPIPTYTSNWTEMDVKTKPFLAFSHDLNEHPVMVRVTLRPTSGELKDFVFQAMTSVQRHADEDVQFGGTVYAYDKTNVYVWVPQDNKEENRFALCVGWPEYMYSTAENITVCEKNIVVQVKVWGPEYFPKPSWDSKWRPIEVTGMNSYIEVYHSLYKYPLVSVQIRSADNGTDFFNKELFADADGATYVTGENKDDPYGGVVYGYDDKSVRVWAPSDYYKNRYLFYVGSDWGDGSFHGHIEKGEVRIRCWVNLDGSGPRTATYNRRKIRGTFDYVFAVRTGNYGETLLDVTIEEEQGNNTGFRFDTIGPGQSHFIKRTTNFGGMVVGQRLGTNQFFLMSPNLQTLGTWVNIGPYYGMGINNVHDIFCHMVARVWKLHKPPVCHKDNGGCEQICTDYVGYHNCSCEPGFEVLPTDMASCEDTDECKTNSSGCQQLCKNSIGSYSCFCWSGFELQADNHTCEAYSTTVELSPTSTVESTAVSKGSRTEVSDSTAIEISTLSSTSKGAGGSNEKSSTTPSQASNPNVGASQNPSQSPSRICSQSPSASVQPYPHSPETVTTLDEPASYCPSLWVLYGMGALCVLLLFSMLCMAAYVSGSKRERPRKDLSVSTLHSMTTKSGVSPISSKPKVSPAWADF